MTPRIGIDPGLDGALAVICPDGIVKIAETPVFGGKGAKREYNVPAMVAMLEAWRGARLVIEAVHSMPKQGVASAFTFGKGYGIWLGIIGAMGIPHILVSPQRWKKHVLADAPKSDAGVAAVATRLYPAAAPLLVGTRGGLKMGPIDALLIAHYGVLSGA